MGSQDRKKASQVFRDTTYVFSKKVPFAEAFPEVEDIRVEVEGERDFGRLVLDKNGMGEFIDCRNSLCYNGGFSIGDVVREMVRQRLTEQNGSKLCQGYEGSPKGHRRYGLCLRGFRYKVAIRYRNQRLPEQP